MRNVPCNVCGEQPCTCPQQHGSSLMWIVRHCSTPGCNTAIRAPYDALGISTCKWCQKNEEEAEVSV